MNIIDLRKNLRESPTGERLGDRRKNPHPFGSPEWLDYIEQNGLERPTHDRRKMHRRACDRRKAEAETRQVGNSYTRILLTPTEKTLLADIYLADLE
jgi:hypothetical protein